MEVHSSTGQLMWLWCQQLPVCIHFAYSSSVRFSFCWLGTVVCCTGAAMLSADCVVLRCMRYRTGALRSHVQKARGLCIHNYQQL